MSDFILGVLCIVGFFAGLFGIAFWLLSVSCDARWDPQRTEFGVFSGCRVFHDGKFVPEDRVRFFEDGK